MGKLWENIDNIIYDNIWKIYGKKRLKHNRHLFEKWIFIKEISIFDIYIYRALYVIEIALCILGIAL